MIRYVRAKLADAVLRSRLVVDGHNFVSTHWRVSVCQEDLCNAIIFRHKDAHGNAHGIAHGTAEIITIHTWIQSKGANPSQSHGCKLSIFV